MPLHVAIYPDDYGKGNAAAPRWRADLEANGVRVSEVDVWRHDILRQLRGVHGLMWRFAQYSDHRQLARRLLPALERYGGIELYPDQNTAWHYDDKIAQAYAFELLEIPHPRTWVFYTRGNAEEWLAEADFPLVMKLATGAGSSNVRLIKSAREANRWLDLLFGGGVESFDEAALPKPLRRAARAGAEVVAGRALYSEKYWDRHKNYALFQQFCPGNDFDTRIAVCGKLAFGFRRFNREGDFRASGSGQLDYTPEKVDPAFIEIAFSIAEKLQLQAVSIDGLYDPDGRPCVGEISYTCDSPVVYDCPGGWNRDLGWHSGNYWLADLQAADFLSRLRRRFGEG
jgi:glutathione synthase/RimK-type ligase-like ATP-grasp enzyme